MFHATTLFNLGDTFAKNAKIPTQWPSSSRSIYPALSINLHFWRNWFFFMEMRWMINAMDDECGGCEQWERLESFRALDRKSNPMLDWRTSACVISIPLANEWSRLLIWCVPCRPLYALHRHRPLSYLTCHDKIYRKISKAGCYCPSKVAILNLITLSSVSF